MIISLARYTARLAVRIKNTVDFGQLTDWQKLQLLIMRPMPRKGCHVGGSPWYLHGCWPFHPTDVDLANPQPPDFPAIAIDAFEADEEGRVVFLLDNRVHALPNGRYAGVIRQHQHTQPINIPVQKTQAGFAPLGAEIFYDEERRRVPCSLPEPILFNPEPSCELFRFDIDLGPECAQHMVDQAVVTLARSSCGDDLEFCGTC